jgi:glutathione S-transferase
LATRQNRLDALASNIDDKIQVAIIMGAYEDVRNAAVKVLFFMPKEEFIRTGEAAFKEATRNHLKKIEYSLKGKKFILGDNPVFEDFALFELTDTVRLFNIKFLKEFPSVFAHNENVRNIPQIKVSILQKTRLT